MSKSYGNVVDPFEMIKSPHALEQLKLYFIVFGSYAHDADFCQQQSAALYNKFVDSIVSCFLRVFSEDCLNNTELAGLDSAAC
jgi:methionyl-tRNA synthetase